MLTDRQNKLYTCLLASYQRDPNHWVSQDEICEKLPEYYSLNHKAVKKMCCSYMHEDIMKLNNSEECDEIIIYKNQSYKIAKDIEEAKYYLKSKLLIKACRMFKRYWNLLNKVNSDGQMTLEGDEIKTFIESQLKQQQNMEEITK